MPLKHEYKNIKTIISKYKTFYVPYYQRRYVWNSVNKGRNLYKFIDDISKEYIGSQNSQYFIGTLALCDHNVTDVVDGQQRLTSLILFLSILSDNKCSTKYKINHKKLVYTNESFIIQESYYLTEELEGVLGYKSYAGTGFKVKLDDAVTKMKNQINKDLADFSTTQFDGLYDYILNNVYVITLEYTNVKDALRYFLNINSLSVELSQAEIFYTILSQALNISHSPRDINTVIAQVDKLKSDYKGIKEPEDILDIFLNAYYFKDTDIANLKEIGVGKWLSYYHTDVFGDPIVADKFCKTFLQFLADIEFVLSLFQNKSTSITIKSPIYLSFSLLNYEKYFDLLEVLVTIFKNRHNYVNQNLFDASGNKIDITKLEDIARRLNITLFHNYIRASNKRLDRFATSIEPDNLGNPKTRLTQLLYDINLDSMFTLGYLNSFQSDPKISIPDQSRLIRVIFSIQEAFLNYKANSTMHMNMYFAELIDTQKYSIEHLYSEKEFTDANRLNAWQSKGRFANANDFDLERSKFENLSLLDSRTNTSANADTIYDKQNKYKNAKAIMNSEYEYLIQSLVDNSEYYRNPNILALGLPERRITEMISNTWKHSPNNKDFNKQLLYKSLEEIIKI